ncbi:hypothetical protein E8F11_12295 [Pseudomonas sp. BN417]|uniref:hypothetical protein n=1 Tax=Pseudomonas sp. BN417 TaxID=2567890 RepID=UPI0024564E66|nr:hypothetical protein [Pseudomonas sp. BN417]MDH4555942.1 hypothetical protein [Pseudomonas sp. BN417]
MSQQFDEDVMDELTADIPAAADELDEGLDMEGFDEGEAYDEAMGDALEDEADFADEAIDEAFALDEYDAADGFDESTDEYDETELLDAFEDVMADALDAGDADEFFGRLLGGVSRLAGLVGRGARGAGQVARTVRGGARQVGGVARTVGRAAGQVGRVAGRVGQVANRVGGIAGRVGNIAGRASGIANQVGGIASNVGRITGRAAQSANPLGSLLQQLVPILQQYQAQGVDELDAFEDMADWLAEEDFDGALPVLGGLAARVLVRPVLQRAAGAGIAQPLRRQLVRSATQAARTLAQRRGPQAVRALPRLAQGVARTAQRRQTPARALPRAIRRTASQVAARPQLVRRLTQIGITGAPAAGGAIGSAQRIRLNGPVELVIHRR